MDHLQAFSALGLVPGVTEAQVTEAYRILVRSAHPDTGGTPEAFLAVQTAYQVALKYARDHPPLCPTCGGTGTVEQGKGVVKVKMACPTCRLASRDSP